MEKDDHFPVIPHLRLSDWLRAWVRHRRKALQYRERVPPLETIATHTDDLRQAETVLFSRSDRLGDWLQSLPFLERLRYSRRRILLRVGPKAVARFLSDLGFETLEVSARRLPFRPDLVLVGESSRHLRSPHHPSRLADLHQILNLSGGAPTVFPCIWRFEAGARFPGSYAPLGGKVTISAVTGSLARWLGLPELKENPPLGHFRSKPGERIVLNLSAGAPGASGRRSFPDSSWVDLCRRLGPATMGLVQPNDEDRLARLARLGLNPAPIRTNLLELASWLGKCKILISPETGLCHLARMIGLPVVVLTPRKLVPFWYQPSARLKILAYDKQISEIQGHHIERAVTDLQEEIQS